MRLICSCVSRSGVKLSHTLCVAILLLFWELNTWYTNAHSHTHTHIRRCVCEWVWLLRYYYGVVRERARTHDRDHLSDYNYVRIFGCERSGACVYASKVE